MSIPPARRPGGQPGNTNAVKHGYYSRCLRSSEQPGSAGADDPVSIADEIDLLRTLLRRVAQYSSQAATLQENLAVLKVVGQASAALGHLLRLQCILTGGPRDEERDALQAAIARVRATFFTGPDPFRPTPPSTPAP